MGIEKRNGKLWFSEELYKDISYGFEVSEILVPEKKTKFQKLMILKTPRFGKVLILDGVVQLTEKDEKIYHEFMAHWPLFSQKNPKTVLIVGGGDGGVAREVLRHKNIKKVYLVDIDSEVIETVKKYIPTIFQNAFSDPRLEIHCEDAVRFIKKIKKASLDAVILDSSDPIGPARSLFGSSFIQDVHKILRDGGIIIRQTGSIIFQEHEFRESYKQIEKVFSTENTRTVLISPASYFGGYFSLVAAIKGRKNFQQMINGAEKRYKKSGIKTDWYSGDLHRNLTILPPLINTMLRKQR
jgi:spermidine synthase